MYTVCTVYVYVDLSLVTFCLLSASERDRVSHQQRAKMVCRYGNFISYSFIIVYGCVFQFTEESRCNTLHYVSLFF